MTAKARIKQADATRLVKACVAGGMKVGTVQVLPDGEIRIYAAGEATAPAANPLDRVLKDNGA